MWFIKFIFLLNLFIKYCSCLKFWQFTFCPASRFKSTCYFFRMAWKCFQDKEKNGVEQVFNRTINRNSVAETLKKSVFWGVHRCATSENPVFFKLRGPPPPFGTKDTRTSWILTPGLDQYSGGSRGRPDTLIIRVLWGCQKGSKIAIFTISLRKNPNIRSKMVIF